VKAFKPLVVASTAATFVLISIGGLVRATKSGLGCGDDWPDCSGQLVPALEQRAQIIEYSHRLAAGVVLVLLATVAALAVRYYRNDRRILWASIGGFGLVMFQAILGMIVVKLHLDAISVVLHLGTALLLLALLLYLSTSLTTDPERAGDERTSKRAKVAAGSVFVLLLVGSYVSGTESGYAFTDWPLMDGALIPDLAVEAKAIHFLHRALAAVVGVIVFAAAFDIIRRDIGFPAARKLVQAAAGLFALEVVIGALNVWTRLNEAAVTAHLAVGAAIWGTLVATTFVTSPSAVRTEPARVSRAPIAEVSG
jgi:heme a synthase